MRAALVTGATGFLGSAVVQELLRTQDGKIYCLVRAKSGREAQYRLKTAWSGRADLYGQVGSRVMAVCGNIEQEGLGLSAEDAALLREEVCVIFHAAAEVGLQTDEERLMSVNREGTRHVTAFAQTLSGLTRFVYFSTAYVAGTRKGVVREEDLPAEQFSSLYEKSKAEAEKIVRASALPWTICRPGMIVGDSKTGWTRNFNTVYYVLKLLLTDQLPVVPTSRKQRLNIVPVDRVAESAVKLSILEEAEKGCFHLTVPTKDQPTAGELCSYVRDWAKKNLGAKPRAPFFVPMPQLMAAGRRYNLRSEGRKKGFMTNLLALSPYFAAGQDFDRSRTDSLLGPCTESWRDSIDALLAFACRKNFMQQTGCTVFEQARRRQAGLRRPVNYYDVAADGIHKVSGPEVNERVDRIVRAFCAWGIRRGDKVALTGINSVDYMTIDQAIGRVGAVSVPIYYTTPADEIDTLLSRSGATWLFVGDRRIMAHIGELKGDAKLVSFSDGEKIASPNVMRWEDFLAKAGDELPEDLPLPEDLATIRYTSGTTGEPKGVKFSYGQLAWMGEVLTNLLDWKERNTSMRYLSFLPLSHVVEGILASYAPYYLLADVDFYFLNDFGQLTAALPKVRPTVFFSVPRFYEKLMNQLEGTGMGRLYFRMKDGILKKALAAVIRRVLLKKAGLDACRQLIVGSAPVSEVLLYRFRELGIEIYNAYGQAEAPLITINRFGDNCIPTIGTPLPETSVETAADGELIVRGPQVCLGYYGLETDTIQNGVLKTGDLGTIGEDGHITLFGRKKEMIVTAYGKNISIPKIEGRLKSIPGVSEAVLIGEKRPYCTALLWLEREIPDLDAQIAQMNENLSHPEQIRAYRIIEKPLSISAKELTPNLKVRRAQVEEHLQDKIQEMYA